MVVAVDWVGRKALVVDSRIEERISGTDRYSSPCSGKRLIQSTSTKEQPNAVHSNTPTTCSAKSVMQTETATQPHRQKYFEPTAYTDSRNKDTKTQALIDRTRLLLEQLKLTNMTSK